MKSDNLVLENVSHFKYDAIKSWVRQTTVAILQQTTGVNAHKVHHHCLQLQYYLLSCCNLQQV